MDWENHFKKSNQIFLKIANIKVKSQHVKKKPLAGKRIFVQTPFSHYFEIGVKNNSLRRTLIFSLQFQFRRDQNHFSDLTSKIMKTGYQIFKT